MSNIGEISVIGGVNADGAVPTSGTGNPATVGGIYKSTAPTYTNGEVTTLQADASGNLKVNVTNATTSGTAGSPSANVLSVQGLASMTPVQTVLGLQTSGGASYSTYVVPTTAPAVQTLKSSAGNLYKIFVSNILATPVYLKFFDIASGSITLGTTAATMQFLVPGNTAGAVLQLDFAQIGGRSFANAINYIVALNAVLTDHTAIGTANSVFVDLSYN